MLELDQPDVRIVDADSAGCLEAGEGGAQAIADAPVGQAGELEAASGEEIIEPDGFDAGGDGRGAGKGNA